MTTLLVLGTLGYIAGVNLPTSLMTESDAIVQDTVAIELRAQERLQKYALGVGIGQPMPDFPLWGEGLASAVAWRDILPAGGVLVLMAGGCLSCVGEMGEIQTIVDGLGRDCRPVILIADRAGGFDSLVVHLRRVGIRFPVYCDVEENLRREFRLITRTVYLSLDASGVLRDMRAWQAHPVGMESLFRRNDSLNAVQALADERR